MLDTCAQLLGDDQPGEVRFAAARLLALALRDAAPVEAVEILLAVFVDPDSNAHSADAAAHALGQLGTTRGLDALISALAVVSEPGAALEVVAVLLERTFERQVRVEGRAYSTHKGRHRIEFWGVGKTPDGFGSNDLRRH